MSVEVRRRGGRQQDAETGATSGHRNAKSDDVRHTNEGDASGEGEMLVPERKDSLASYEGRSIGGSVNFPRLQPSFASYLL